MLCYTVLVDGPTDRALLPVLDWLLWEIGVRFPPLGECVTPSQLRRVDPKIKSLDEKIQLALDLFPCHVLFVHRDAENQGLDFRANEVIDALESASTKINLPYAVPVIPVRMHESWLLFDEAAIRKASGNPNGNARLDLPDIDKVEDIPDPKELLEELLKISCGLTGRRLRIFNASSARNRVAEFIDDFSPLRALEAFRRLENDLKDQLQYSAWL